jgi:hypothetical protein
MYLPCKHQQIEGIGRELTSLIAESSFERS